MNEIFDLNLMVTAVINLDLVPLFLFFFLYSALEIFIARIMEDYHRVRLTQIQQQFAEDEFESDDENPLPESDFMPPVHLGIFQSAEFDDFDDDDDDDDDGYEDNEEYEDDVDDEEEEEEEEEFVLDRDLNNNNNNDININNNNLTEDEDYEDEDFEEEEEELEELFPAVMTSPRVSISWPFVHDRVVLGGMVVNDDGDGDGDGVGEEEDSSGSELCEGKSGNGEKKCGGEFHGSFCPICFEAWTSGGEHQICCLPCGHIYGLSCIKKWLQQSPNSGKCPQCNNICTLKDVRVLYASRLCVADEELQKRVRSLEAKCAYLEQKAGPLTPDELIDQICSNPAAVQRLATVLAGLTKHPVSP